MVKIKHYIEIPTQVGLLLERLPAKELSLCIKE